MLNIKRILLPVDIPISTHAVLREAATLAHHFHSEIILLHVITERSLEAGVPADEHAAANWDLLAAVLRQAREERDEKLVADFDGLAVRGELADGDVATAIVQTAHEQRADLIMIPSYSFTFAKFLLGSVTAKVLHGTECPVWTGAHVEELPRRDFAIRNVLCAVDLASRNVKHVAWAAQLATEFGARLTLAHVTAALELWGPGGNIVDHVWEKAILGNAMRQMDKFREEMGAKAEVFIGSGDVPKVLSQAAKQTKADLLVTGCYPYGGHLRTHGYGIICSVQVPVLNV